MSQLWPGYVGLFIYLLMYSEVIAVNVKPLNEFTAEELMAFKQAADKLRQLKDNTRPLNKKLLGQLITLAQRLPAFQPSFNLIAFEYAPSACGCMGPEGDNMYCRCIMSELLSEYKFDVALEMMYPAFGLEPRFLQKS